MANDFETRTRVWQEARDLVYNVINCDKPIVSALQPARPSARAWWRACWPTSLRRGARCAHVDRPYAAGRGLPGDHAGSYLLLCEPVSGEHESEVRHGHHGVAGPNFDTSLALEFMGFGAAGRSVRKAASPSLQRELAAAEVLGSWDTAPMFPRSLLQFLARFVLARVRAARGRWWSQRRALRQDAGACGLDLVLVGHMVESCCRAAATRAMRDLPAWTARCAARPSQPPPSLGGAGLARAAACHGAGRCSAASGCGASGIHPGAGSRSAGVHLRLIFLPATTPAPFVSSRTRRAPAPPSQAWMPDHEHSRFRLSFSSATARSRDTGSKGLRARQPRLPEAFADSELDTRPASRSATAAAKRPPANWWWRFPPACAACIRCPRLAGRWRWNPPAADLTWASAGPRRPARTYCLPSAYYDEFVLVAHLPAQAAARSTGRCARCANRAGPTGSKFRAKGRSCPS